MIVGGLTSIGFFCYIYFIINQIAADNGREDKSHSGKDFLFEGLR